MFTAVIDNPVFKHFQFGYFFYFKQCLYKLTIFLNSPIFPINDTIILNKSYWQTKILLNRFEYQNFVNQKLRLKI